MLVIYVKVNPYLFPYSTGRELNTLMLIIFFTSFLIPGIAMLLMMGVGFIDSLHMKDKSERIGPLMVTGICYLWLYLNIRTHNAIPIPYANFILGSIISLFIAFFINNFSKISLHGVGLGGLFIGVMHLFLMHGQEYLSFDLVGQTYALHYILLIGILLMLIGDMTCTGVWKSTAATTDDIIEEVATTRMTERGGRTDDKRSETSMEDRKKKGYF